MSFSIPLYRTINRYCDDHMPEHSVIIRHCQRFVNMGIPHPKQACYILCDPECQQRAKERLPPEEQPQHVAAAFDRCATAAAQAEEAANIAAQNIEAMLEAEAAKKADTLIPAEVFNFGLTDSADREAVLEADRLLGGGFKIGPRSTRNKIVSYAGPKGTTITAADSDEYHTESEDGSDDDDDDDDDEFAPSYAKRAPYTHSHKSSTDVGAGAAVGAAGTGTVSSATAKKAHGGITRNPPRFQYPSGHSGYLHWYNINFDYFVR